MKRIIAIVLFAAVPALGQQPEPDPKNATYQQMLADRSEQLAQAAVQIHVLAKEVERLKKACPAPEPKK